MAFSSPIRLYNTNYFWSLVSSTGIMYFTFFVFAFFIYLCFYKTEKVIELLRLEVGLKNEIIEFNLDQKSIISIAVIIIGGVVFIDSIPLFLKSFFIFIKEMNATENPSVDSDPQWIFYYLIKSIIGFVLMANYKQIAVFFEPKSNA